MTAEEFTRNDANRTRLIELLADPVLAAALAVLKGEKEPLSDSITLTNPVLAASRFQEICGVNHVLKGLERLTKTPVVVKPLRGKQLEPEHLDP